MGEIFPQPSEACCTWGLFCGRIIGTCRMIDSYSETNSSLTSWQ